MLHVGRFKEGAWVCLALLIGLCWSGMAGAWPAVDLGQGFAAWPAVDLTQGFVGGSDSSSLLLVGFAGTTTALANSALTLSDWARLQDPDGKVSVVANLLSQTNEILEDAVFMEANQATGHVMTVATGLPTAYWRSYNMGVPPSKATTAKVTEAMGMLEAYCRVDKDLALLNGNSAAFRMQESNLFLESMNQQQAQALFYGNPALDPRMPMGFRSRYNNLSAPNAVNIINAGGTTTYNTSIWLVVWGENTVFCPFPKGSKAGLTFDDQGELTVYDANGNPYQALQSHYQWKNGLAVKDWRYVVRIANIPVDPVNGIGNYVASTNTGTDLVGLMSRALDRIPNLNAGRACFYMNRTVFSWLRLQALNRSQNAIAIEPALNQFGQPAQWARFLGVPLRKVDQLSVAESLVTSSS